MVMMPFFICFFFVLFLFYVLFCLVWFFCFFGFFCFFCCFFLDIFKVLLDSFQTSLNCQKLTKYQLWNHQESSDVFKNNEVSMKIFGPILTK